MTVQMIPCDREGKFKAHITEYGLREEPSGSVNLQIKATLTDLWNGSEWEPWEMYNMQAVGFLNLVTTKSAINKNQVVPLCHYAGWDGDFMSIINQEWQPTPCQVDVKTSTYKDKTTLRIEWLAAYDRTPGGMGNLDAERAKSLQARFGSDVRALVGNLNRNASRPQGAPPTPPPPAQQQPAMASNRNAAPSQNSDDEIPFSWLIGMASAALALAPLIA